MGYLVHWDNEEKTVVLQQYIGKPVKEDLYGLAEESALLLKSVPYRVHLIIDERNIKLALNSEDIKFLEKYVPANQGAVVTVASESSLAYKRYIENVGKKLGPKAFDQPYYATTVDAARDLLQKQFSVRYP
jgi:hypothetical protein